MTPRRLEIRFLEGKETVTDPIRLKLNKRRKIVFVWSVGGGGYPIFLLLLFNFTRICTSLLRLDIVDKSRHVANVNYGFSPTACVNSHTSGSVEAPWSSSIASSATDSLFTSTTRSTSSTILAFASTFPFSSSSSTTSTASWNSSFD